MSKHQEAPPPTLRFVATDKVLPHEEADHQRYAPLMRRIVDSGVWLHPPIVAPLKEMDGYYVILDGANRCHAVKALGYPHILVQIASYDSGQVTLDTWNHVVTGLPLSEFLPAIAEISNIQIHQTDLLTAQANLAQRNILSYIVDYDTKEIHTLHLTDHSLHTRNAVLRHLVTTYKFQGTLDRANTDHLETVRRLYPQANALIVFPHYEPAEIMVAARDNEPLPPGISRHIIQGRAMRLNYPLDTLADTEQSADQKNAALADWILARIAARAVRFYAESVYMFDE